MAVDTVNIAIAAAMAIAISVATHVGIGTAIGSIVIEVQISRCMYRRRYIK